MPPPLEYSQDAVVVDGISSIAKTRKPTITSALWHRQSKTCVASGVSTAERPREAFKHGLLAMLQRAQSYALGKATLQTSLVAIPRDLPVQLVFLASTTVCLFIRPAKAQ